MPKSQFYRSTTVEALNNEKVQLISMDDASKITAGSTLILNFYADPGYIAQILGMNVTFDHDAAATTGQRNLQFNQANNAIGLMIASASFNKDLEFRNYEYKYFDITSEPSNDNMVLVLQNARYDETNGISILFANLTDKDYVLNRKIRLYIKQTKIF